jgi:diguanylate cyclase (GGDEF)-like protein
MMEGDTTIRVPPPQPLNSGACLVYIYPTGPGIGRRFPVEAAPLLLGRDDDCDIPLTDPSVSRRHAQLRPAEDGCYAIDLDSKNGTFVNDEPITVRRLRDGDYLRVGSSIFRFLDSGNIEAAYHEEIYRLTIQDVLTGLPNRRHLLEFVKRELVRSARYRRPLALVLLDVDRFKSVNDQLGHLGGDAALREMASLLRSLASPGDLAARYGGEEFALTLVESGPDAAHASAEQVRGAVERHAFTYAGRTFALTVSLGVAVETPTGPAEAEALLRRADEKLYEAKRAGGNRVAG